MKGKFIVGIDPYCPDEQGYVIHRQKPEFVAKWTVSGELIEGLVFVDEDDEDDDNEMQIYDFPPTTPKDLLVECARTIDEYLMCISDLREEEQ
tara:strand:+ start:141 stop:419 length:279 start_codon:yes stop_codon:yes gene_type:complete